MSEKLSIEDLIKRLTDISKNGYDSEADHIKADKLLLEFINDERVTVAFDYISKWYA